MDNEFGCCIDEVIYSLESTYFANEYYDLSNTQRLKLLNKILQILGEYGAYEMSEV